MLSVSTIVHIRRKRDLRGRTASHAALTLALLISLITAGFALGVALAYTQLTRELPSVEVLALWLEPPHGILLQPTRFYDRSGEHVIYTLELPNIPQRKYLYFPTSATLEEARSASDFLPAPLVAATLATFDPAFWDHPHFSFQDLLDQNTPSLARRLVSDLLFARHKPGIKRAFQENILAAQLVRKYGPGKIIEWFLNSVAFGHGVYGAEAAAQFYFGKPASSLSAAEAAFLCAIAENPGLNPAISQDDLIKRQKEIIQKMLQEQWLTPDEATQAAQEELSLLPLPASMPGVHQGKLEAGISPFYISLVLQQLGQILPVAELQRGGYRVITTLDTELQAELFCTLSYQLSRVNNSTSPEVPEACTASRLLPSLVQKAALPGSPLQGEALLLDVRRGQVLAFASSSEPAHSSTALPRHPAGTMITPFIYLTAFTRGMGPASLVWDIPPDSESLIPLQELSSSYHGPVRLRLALANDYLMPAFQVIQQVGAENIGHMLQQLGIAFLEGEANLLTSQPEAFFEAKVSLLDLAKGYAVIANQGMSATTLGAKGQNAPDSTNNRFTSNLSSSPLSVVLRVERASGEVITSWEEVDQRPIVAPQLAYLLHHILSDEIARWPSLGHPNPLEIGRPAAVKLGKTLRGEGAWVIGYLPQLLAGVWIGAEPPFEADAAAQEMMRNAAAGLLHAIAQYNRARFPLQDWQRPPGIVQVQVCDPSGMLPTPSCANVVNEIFLEGSEPTHNDTLYQLVPINRSNGKLATIFTPPELISERAFLSIPPEAESWAKLAGVELAPKDYDVIPADLPVYAEAHITEPAMFAFVRGTVPIIGSAGGAGFSSYILQYGAGLYPQSWYTLVESDRRVSEGTLATWDTQGLDGLYVVQLLVVREDRNIKRANLLVTVDNLPPQISIVYPYPGSTMRAAVEKLITFSAEVQDNIRVQSVSFILDGTTLITLEQPPYAYTWEAIIGAHQLRLIATDVAGNSNEAQINFNIE